MSQATTNNLLEEDDFFSEILSSQFDLEDQIQTIKTIHSDKSVGEKLNELQRFLSNENMKNATVDMLDEKIFSSVLADARNIYLEVIKNIDKEMQNKENFDTDVIKGHLKVLGDIPKCWDSCINCIKSLEKLSVIDIKSFTVSLFETLIDILNHCKASAKYYGDKFKVLTENLSLTFRQCVTTLNLFYALLDSNISFDANQDTEMKFLLHIIDETGKIATLLCGMDTKSLTEMWKRFGKLASNYNLQMKKITPDLITNHLKGLSENIEEILLSITPKIPQTVSERSTLCCRLLLKILEKLSETYCGWIRIDAMLAIVTLLCHIHQFTEPCLKISGHKDDFVKFVQTNFMCTIDSFLAVVFKSDSFKLAFFEYNNKSTNNAVGYHLLSLTVIKRVSTLPYETQREWCNTKNNVVEVCFQNIDKLTKDVCSGKLQAQMSRNVAQGSYFANIYEATFLSVCAIACQVTSSDINEFVMMLLKYLLSGNFFGSLLSCDVWCFVCRLGSSDFCYSHFKYLMLVYENLRDRKNCINAVMLSHLLKRQYNFLADKDKLDFIDNIKKDSSSHGWDIIARVMNEEKKKLLQQKINAIDVNNKIAGDLKNLEEQPSLNNLCSVMNDLSIIEASGITQNQQSADTFTKMWNNIVLLHDDCEGTLSILLEKLIISLLRATRPEQGQARYTISVFESLVALYPVASSGSRLEFSDYLSRRAQHITAPNSSVASDLLCRLLNDREPSVQQQGLECFDRLTRLCTDSNLLSVIALNVRNSQSEMSKTVPAYITAEVAHRLFGFTDLDGYFRALDESTRVNRHACREISPDIAREEKLPRLDAIADQRDGSDDNVERIVERVCEDVGALTRLGGQLSDDSCDRLRRVFRGFLGQSSVRFGHES